MSLLLEEDYKFLEDTNLNYEEDEEKRFFIITNHPLAEGLYVSDENPINQVEVLVIIPGNYNMSGTDMLWTYPSITLADNGPMPNVSGYNDLNNHTYNGKEFCRWSRHYEEVSWKPKVDNIEKILSRIEWALRNPSTT